jgi:hypothetical protein
MNWQYRWHYAAELKIAGPSSWYDYSHSSKFNPAPGVTLEWREVPPPFKPGYFRSRKGATAWYVSSEAELPRLYPDGGFTRVSVNPVDDDGLFYEGEHP